MKQPRKKPTSMKRRIKKLWIDFLESDKFKQARRRLKDKNKMCCLGILCEIHRQETGGKWEGVSENIYLDAISLLPAKVVKWAGIDSEFESDLDDPPIFWDEKNEEFLKASQCNDERKFNFKKIAQLIKENVKGR